jgi:hypothetical protein
MASEPTSYRPFQEFESTAIPAPGVPLRSTPSNWSAAGPVLIVHQDIACDPEPTASARELELAHTDSTRLLELVERQGDSLSLDELQMIERIASARARETDGGEAARLLSVVARSIADRPL